MAKWSIEGIKLSYTELYLDWLYFWQLKGLGFLIFLLFIFEGKRFGYQRSQ